MSAPIFVPDPEHPSNRVQVTANTPWEALPHTLKVKEAAVLAGLHERVVYELIAQNRFPHFRVGERGIRVNRDALREWMNAPTPAPEKPAGVIVKTHLFRDDPDFTDTRTHTGLRGPGGSDRPV